MDIVLVGLGVIGGSFAQALKSAGYADVYGVDTDAQTVQKAKERALIADGGTDAAQWLPRGDLVIVSLYPLLLAPFMRQNMRHFKGGCVVTDTTGVKTMVVDAITALLRDDVDFVFGHPMAGREKKGIDFADARVFAGANYLITPTPRNQEKNIVAVEDLMRRLGFGSVRRITPALHDEMIGYTSQLPHALAVALVNSDDHQRDTGSFIGDSYRDLTRIANINAELWSELFLGNRDNLLAAIHAFQQELETIRRAVEQGDKQTLTACFARSSARREALQK
ncbi:MAG: prephenate dehydrogenase [Eubacteriales bacterium]|nr:prephenate dehydrogenase [Eubacteriales bacterium]